MMHKTGLAYRVIAICAFCCLAMSSRGATIIKLNLGSVGPDVSMSGGGVFGTVSDGVAATTGDQNTDVEYTGFFDGPFPDITTTDASFSMTGLLATGPATVFGSLVIQPFTGGTFNLYNPANVLLLTGPLTSSALTGVMGPPGTGALFTTSLGTVTGGTLAPLIAPGTVSLSINMTNVNGGLGFGVGGGAAPILLPFTADASVNIAANPVPEPAALVLVLVGSGAAAVFARRRSR
jgi:PEP-CTERM motif